MRKPASQIPLRTPSTAWLFPERMASPGAANVVIRAVAITACMVVVPSISRFRKQLD